MSLATSVHSLLRLTGMIPNISSVFANITWFCHFMVYLALKNENVLQSSPRVIVTDVQLLFPL